MNDTSKGFNAFQWVEEEIVYEFMFEGIPT
jgi:hypothetical protein